MIGALGRSSRVGRSTDSPPTPESKNSSGEAGSMARLCGVANDGSQGRDCCVGAPFATTMKMTAELLWAWLLGYLLGSIPFGLLLTRMAGKGDVRDVGSGNIGATNVLRAGGKGVATLLGILIPLLPIAAIVYALVWLGLLATIRISSVAGMAAAVSAPISGAVLGPDYLFPM